MNSQADPAFWKRFDELPGEIQELARKNYAFWLRSPFHPSLQFKRIKGELWSVRIGSRYRAVGYFLNPETFVWIWIGTHEEYNKF